MSEELQAASFEKLPPTTGQLLRAGLPEDHERHIPIEYCGPLEPNYYCRHWNPRREKYCGARAGYGTDHLGKGRCMFGGGNNDAKHGRFSAIRSERLQELMQKHEADPDPLNVLPELHLMRALVEDYVDRFAELTEAHVLWLALVRAREDEGDVLRMRFRARELVDHLLEESPAAALPDISDATQLLDRIMNAVSRIETNASKNAISRPELYRVLGEMGRVVETLTEQLFGGVVKDELVAEYLEKVQTQWLTIRV